MACKKKANPEICKRLVRLVRWKGEISFTGTRASLKPLTKTKEFNGVCLYELWRAIRHLLQQGVLTHKDGRTVCYSR